MKLRVFDCVFVCPSSWDYLWIFFDGALVFSGHSIEGHQVASLLAQSRGLIRTVKLLEVDDEWCTHNAPEHIDDIPAEQIRAERSLVEFDIRISGAQINIELLRSEP